jgi:Bacterial type II/III secretion system short domain
MKTSHRPSMFLCSMTLLFVLSPGGAVTRGDDAAVPRRANDGQPGSPPPQVGHDKRMRSPDKPNLEAVTPPNFTLQVINLQHIRAEAALPIVRDIFVARGSNSWMRPRFAIDEVNNRLIAHGDPDTLRAVLALILKLDQQGNSGEDEPKTVVFELKNTNPEMAQKAVRELGLTGLTSVADPRTKTLIVNGLKNAVARAKTVVNVLDAPPPASHASDILIRVAWLVAKGQAMPNAAAVPSDLAPAVDSLRKKLQIGELATASQMVINLDSNDANTFNSSGTANLNELYALQLSGNLTQSESHTYQIFVQFHVAQEKGGRMVCGLNTTCSNLVPNHPVLVGMTTLNSLPSLFVIELLPK